MALHKDIKNTRKKSSFSYN